MSEMVERVAKVLWDEIIGDGIRKTERDEIEYKIIAHAVIKAMKEPTEEMIAAVGTGECFIEDHIEDFYKSMIEAALK